VTTVLARPLLVSVDSFARASGLHPELVRRLIRLGLLDATYDASGTPFVAPGQLARAARIQRLRDSLSVNYAALGLVLDLLDRIDNLEAAQRSRPRSYGGTDRRWTRTA
jgi:chaperone modulatory protein CbpM